MRNPFNIIQKIYWQYFASPLDYARHIGVTIGENNLIQKCHWSSEPYLITVGSNCQLTNCKIFTHGGGGAIRDKYPDFDAFGKVKIGDWVYIGTNSLIMPGVTIGNNVLVSAGSVVTKSIESNLVVGGNPAKVISTIDEFYKRNKKYNIGTKKLNPMEKKQFLLSLDSDKFICK